MTAPQQTGTALVRPEVNTLTAHQRSAISEAAGIWGGEKWTTLEKLKPHDLERVARAVVQAFPDFGPLEITKYFELMGGKIRETAEFWFAMAAQHPQYDGHSQRRIKPHTDEWEEWLGSMDPSLVAAAYLTEVRRKDRALPFIEASYVLFADSMLSDYEWVNLPGCATRAQAEANAPAGYDKLWQDRERQTWQARVPTRKPDAEPLGMKKCRTTSARRAFRKAFSLQEAKVTSLLRRVEAGLEDVHARRDYAAELPATLDAGGGLQLRGSGRAQPASIRDVSNDYGEETPRLPAPKPAPEPPAITEVKQAETVAHLITDADRRKMFTWLNDRDLGGKAKLDVLHELIAEVQCVPVEQASVKKLTYPQWAQVCELVERYPIVAGDAAEDDRAIDQRLAGGEG